MARITIEDCSRRIHNRFILVHTVARRVREIRQGSQHLVDSPKNEDVVIALREVAAGKIGVAEKESEDQDEKRRESMKKSEKAKTTTKKPKTASRKAATVKPASKKATTMSKGIKKEYTKGDNLCRVTFTLPRIAAIDAKSVCIVGDFNHWNTDANRMRKLNNGDYTIELELATGKEYEFRYLIDESKWENDWNADRYVTSPYGDSDNSVVKV